VLTVIRIETGRVIAERRESRDVLGHAVVDRGIVRCGVLRGVALLRSESRAAKVACAPALCSMVADTLRTLL